MFKDQYELSLELSSVTENSLKYILWTDENGSSINVRIRDGVMYFNKSEIDKIIKRIQVIVDSLDTAIN